MTKLHFGKSNYVGLCFWCSFLFVSFGFTLRISTVIDCNKFIEDTNITLQECLTVIPQFSNFLIIIMVILSFLGIFGYVRYRMLPNEPSKFTKQPISELPE